MTDHIATANICSLLLLGIFAGTKLITNANQSGTRNESKRLNCIEGVKTLRGETHFTFACRAATGLIGVTDNFESLSLREEAEMVLDADVSFGG